MKFAALIEYADDKELLKAVFPAHRIYLRSLLESGVLFAAGPLTEDGGALWIYEAETLDAADELIKADPFHAAGAFVKWQIHPLSYWSAKECKGK